MERRVIQQLSKAPEPQRVEVSAPSAQSSRIASDHWLHYKKYSPPSREVVDRILSTHGFPAHCWEMVFHHLPHIFSFVEDAFAEAFASAERPSRTEQIRHLKKFVKELVRMVTAARFIQRPVLPPAAPILNSLYAEAKKAERQLTELLREDAGSPRASGGRPRNWRRHDALVGLCDLYDELGGRPAMGEGPFSEFCGHMFWAVGWPENGIVAALPEVVRYWRKYHGPGWNMRGYFD